MRKVICTPKPFSGIPKGWILNANRPFETVRKNERFFIGDQWHGVQANGLPRPHTIS